MVFGESTILIPFLLFNFSTISSISLLDIFLSSNIISGDVMLKFLLKFSFDTWNGKDFGRASSSL